MGGKLHGALWLQVPFHHAGLLEPRQQILNAGLVTGDKTSVEDLLAWLKEPGMMEWNLQPQGTMKFAAHLFKVGTLKTMPKAFTDYYLPVAHDLQGNWSTWPRFSTSVT